MRSLQAQAGRCHGLGCRLYRQVHQTFYKETQKQKFLKTQNRNLWNMQKQNISVSLKQKSSTLMKMEIYENDETEIIQEMKTTNVGKYGNKHLGFRWKNLKLRKHTSWVGVGCSSCTDLWETNRHSEICFDLGGKKHMFRLVTGKIRTLITSEPMLLYAHTYTFWYMIAIYIWISYLHTIKIFMPVQGLEKISSNHFIS